MELLCTAELVQTPQQLQVTMPVALQAWLGGGEEGDSPVDRDEFWAGETAGG